MSESLDNISSEKNVVSPNRTQMAEGRVGKRSFVSSIDANWCNSESITFTSFHPLFFPVFLNIISGFPMKSLQFSNRNQYFVCVLHSIPAQNKTMHYCGRSNLIKPKTWRLDLRFNCNAYEYVHSSKGLAHIRRRILGWIQILHLQFNLTQLEPRLLLTAATMPNTIE